ncbi:lytic transglycosylase domain-containing protein [Cryobacterium sp. TMT2-15-1]|nr:lytic transglycosylase domain-containing protein [Cryobacterium sp. TMT2-15-1]
MPIRAAAAIGTDIGFTRHQETRRRRGRSRLFVAGAVIAVGAIVGSGFSAQSASQAAEAEQKKRIIATAALAAATGPHPEQAGSLEGVVPAHASASARTTLAGATGVIAAAQGKTDVSALSSTVASLSEYTLLAPERVFDLVETVTAQAEVVKASTAEADRLAAEQAAAATAAAAAAQAAADAQAQAAAQAAAPKPAAPKPVAPSPAPPRPAAPTNPSGAQAIARDMMASKYGWGADQLGCLVSLWNKESGWNVNAYNASSGATGIPQALPGSKMASAGADWATNPATQISWGLNYIAERYGDPCGAWNKSVASGWY